MLDHFFAPKVLSVAEESGSYTPLLIIASYLVACFGAYAALTLAAQIFQTSDWRKKRFLTFAGAMALGIGIWSMHFIGMLAYHLRMIVHYNATLTLLSMVIAVVVAYFVLSITQVARLSLPRIILSATLLGSGICAMHYTGMAAMEMRADVYYIPVYFVLSWIIAVTASAAALWIIFKLGRDAIDHQTFWRVTAAMVMGAAICGMHYMGMAAAIFVPFPDCHFDADQSFDLLAFAVLATTIVILTLLTFAISRRLFIIVGLAVLFSFPLLAIVHQSVTDLDKQLRVTNNELHGLEYHQKLLLVQEDLEELRDLLFISRIGKASFAGEQKTSASQKLTKDLMAADQADQSFGDELQSRDGWRATDAAINGVLTEETPGDRFAEYRSYTKLIGTLKTFMEGLADHANLANDPVLATNYFEEAAIADMPDFIDTAGRLRTLAAGTFATDQGPVADADVAYLQDLRNELRLEDERIKSSLMHARQTSDRAAPLLTYHDKALKLQIDLLESRLTADRPDHKINLATAEAYTQASEIISDGNSLYAMVLATFRDLLTVRSNQYNEKHSLVLLASVAAFIGFIGLFIFFYRNLSKTERAEKQAVISNQTKSEFLANMSHELRTPMNGILGTLRLMLGTRVNEEQRQLLNTAFRSSMSLLDIVNGILDLSKIEAHEVKLEHIGFDPHYVMDSVVLNLQNIAREKDITIIPQLEAAEIPLVMGDPTRFSSILTNLVGNAIKYTEHGTVIVRVIKSVLNTEKVILRFEVIDSGIGIPEEKLSTIFEKFSQADTSTTRKYGGTGLGLTITKELVELMGGTIGVRSQIGQGSTFWFEIPFTVTSTVHHDERKHRTLIGVEAIPASEGKILIAEDHPVNRILIVKLLEKLQVGKVTVVENGAEALAAAKTGVWDAILMDCHMPVMNGYDATHEIRALPTDIEKRVPIIAMTANAMIGDREKCLRFGMDDYISKPINPDELLSILGQWIRIDKSLLSPPAEPQTEPQRKPQAAPAIDLAEFRSFTGGDKAIEHELLTSFVRQSDVNLDSLTANAVSGVNDEWVESAHMLKGGASGIGAHQLSELCHEAQLMVDGREAQRKILLGRIAAAYQRIKRELAANGIEAAAEHKPGG